MTERTFSDYDTGTLVEFSETPDVAPHFAAASDREVRNRQVRLAVERACKRIAPLWPLKSFVAVNPFLGLTDESFVSACTRLKRVTGADLLMPRSFFRDAIQKGRITRDDLRQALTQRTQGKVTYLAVTDLEQALALDPPPAETIATTVADLAAEQGRLRSSLLIDEIGKWCAAYWDEGQAAWRMPWQGQGLYKAWRLAAAHDRTPELMGVRGLRTALAQLPDDPLVTIAWVVEQLAIPEAACETYLHRALAGVGGWAAYARYRGWEHELSGRSDDTLEQLLAIRLTWEFAIFADNADRSFRLAWAAAAERMARSPGEPPAETMLDGILQDAYECGVQRRLLMRLSEKPDPARRSDGDRPAVQAAFCIDVRSEVFRRALETTSPQVETIGFAGFFGFPIEYVPIGRLQGSAQCPVLLKPRFIVCEAVQDASEAERLDVLERRVVLRRIHKAWKGFKTAAVSSFAYIETAGLLFGPKLVSDTQGLTRTVAHPAEVGLSQAVRRRVGPDLSPGSLAGRSTGFTASERLSMAEAVLSAMSLQGGFARLVLLAGHGSSTVNNPHASGLDCGACGGHTGEANARVAAAILNDAEVRAGLAERGIIVPADTWFVAGLHNTTTDELKLFELDRVPASHAGDVRQLQDWLDAAAALTRMERATLLGIGSRDRRTVDAAVTRRSRDWSQVRPEWGLAGNAAFIAAPRSRTRGLDLSGRAFLHSYDWREDRDFGVLELIMTAPLVVASWINLQYYGSTVDNRAFGAGNKTLHNVVGTFGVLEGNGGDLRTGLPWQSVHDGTRLVHEPVRLNAFIEAPKEAIARVLQVHEGIRHLVENQWLHLFQIEPDARINRYRAGGSWQAV